MRSWLLPLLLASSALVKAAEVQIDQSEDNRQRCSGMYNRKAWGGTIDPFILVDFKKPDPREKDPAVSLVIFEWKDERFVGMNIDGSDSEDEWDDRRTYICSSEAVKAKVCNDKQLGEFIINPKANKTSTSSIFTQAVHLNSTSPIKYPIKRTGYYCVLTYGYAAKEYSALVEFRNAYGELPASQIAKLPFYGGITIIYALIGIFWGFLYYQHRSDILPVQNYITAIIIFMIMEMLMTWGFYEYMNVHGSNVGAKIFMIIVAVLNAARNSFSFFLLLIVCMGYGVVKPSLGPTMWYCRALALAHFVFGVIYAIASLAIVSPEAAGPLILFVILPLAATLTAFYVWTLNSLNMTQKDLLDRKQNVKALMYKRLWWVLLASILVIFGFFFLNSLSFAGHNNRDFIPTHWQTRWFILDGWLNIIFLVDMSIIAYLWRPTLNNRRFAMSDEIAQEDDGFEIASIGGSDDDEEARPGAAGHVHPSAHPSHSHGVTREGGHEPLPRESTEGEAIFSIGDAGDGWSDESRDLQERTRLNKKE